MPNPNSSARSGRTRAEPEVLATVVVMALAMSSCMPLESVNGFAMRTDTLWSSVFVDTWSDRTDSTSSRMSVESEDSDGLTLRLYDEDSDGIEIRLHPVRLGSHWFADGKLIEFTGEDGDGMDSLEAESITSYFRHRLIFRLDLSADSLALSYFSDRAVPAFLETHRNQLKIRIRPNLGPELASDTKQIRRFLATYGDVDSLFEPWAVLRRD